MPLLCQGCLRPSVYLLGQGVNLYQKPQREKHQTVIFRVPLYAIYSVSYYIIPYLPDDYHLYCVTSECTTVQLGRKEKAALSIKYPFVYPFWGKGVKDALSLSRQPASFSCSPELFNQKCQEISSILNGTIWRFL